MNPIKYVSLCLLATTNLVASDWPSWRGAAGDNHAPEGAEPVTEWSADENIGWSVKLPGLGHSTPIVVGGKIFLTTSDLAESTQSLVAIDRVSGKILWQEVVNKGKLSDKIHRENTHASPSPAWDGERVLTLFLNAGQLQVTAVTPDGDVVWSKYVGAFNSERGWGYGSSPVLYKGLIIVASDFRPGGYLVALDSKTGEEKWRAARVDDEKIIEGKLKGENASWGTPVVAHVAGRDQLLLSGRYKISSYDPGSGKLLWSAPHAPLCTCGTAVWTDDAVFVSGGYPTNQTKAVEADGSGETRWENTERVYEQSMLVHDGYVYSVTDMGKAVCWRASDGKEMWAERIGRGGVMASPVYANGMIFAAMKNGTVTVFEASSDAFEEVASNKLGDDAYASPVIVDQEVFLRVGFRERGIRSEVLFCIRGEASGRE